MKCEVAASQVAQGKHNAPAPGLNNGPQIDSLRESLQRPVPTLGLSERLLRAVYGAVSNEANKVRAIGEDTMNTTTRGSRWFASLTIVAILFQIPIAARAASLVYDLSKDWSTSRNPNGAWSYNLNDQPISVFQTFWWGEAGWGSNWIADGSILKGAPPSGIDPWGNPVRVPHDWQPGDVMLHALSVPYGGEVRFVNIKWTSPEDGVIAISGRAWDGEIFEDRNVGWMLLVRGQVVAKRASVRGLDRTEEGADLEANLLSHKQLRGIEVQKGDVVEFRVVTESQFGHFVGVEMRITLHAPASASRHSRSQSDAVR